MCHHHITSRISSKVLFDIDILLFYFVLYVQNQVIRQKYLAHKLGLKRIDEI